MRRAHELCEYGLCPLALSSSPFEIEHIVPIAAGGSSELSNLALACGGCNGFKGERVEVTDPVTGEQVRLYHPRQGQWNDHFTWNSDFLQMIGLSPIGRAMIVALQLNRPGVQKQRRSLIRDGEHPPTF